MSQPKTLSTIACVPVYDEGTQSPKPVAARVYAPATCGVCGQLPPDEYLADLRAPADCYHSEQYLIKWLVRLYGWRVIEPGSLRRGSRTGPSRIVSQTTQPQPELAPNGSTVVGEVAA